MAVSGSGLVYSCTSARGMLVLSAVIGEQHHLIYPEELQRVCWKHGSADSSSALYIRLLYCTQVDTCQVLSSLNPGGHTLHTRCRCVCVRGPMGVG
jgi:hypothetical protein